MSGVQEQAEQIPEGLEQNRRGRLGRPERLPQSVCCRYLVLEEFGLILGKFWLEDRRVGQDHLSSSSWEQMIPLLWPASLQTTC